MRPLFLLLSLGLALAPLRAAAAGPPDASVASETPPERLVAEIPVAVYAARRAKLMDRLGGCVGVLRSVPDDTLGLDPYFYYLTGVTEPGAVLVLAPRERVYKTTLLLTPRDAEAEIWEGYREPMSAALRGRYGVDQVARTRGGAPRQLTRALRHTSCYAELRAAFDHEPGLDDKVAGPLFEAFETRTVQRWQQLERLRAVHDAPEIARLEEAIRITFAGQAAAVRTMAAGATERVVKGAIEAGFYGAGGTGLAFETIVGSGPNGAVLHWGAEDRVIAEGDLAVVDIGASFGGYAADITRTYPVSGRFSDEHRRIYEIVLEAQNAAIAAVRPGVTLEELHRIAERVIVDAGYELPHSIGHFVGLEVHDVGDTGAPLEAGMVITVEPGVYLEGKFGVRIEDMVLVTPRGHRLMSEGLPREPDAVQAWMAQQRATR